MHAKRSEGNAGGDLPDDDEEFDEVDRDYDDDAIDISDSDDDDDDDNDNIGDLSVELNVEELMEKLEQTQSGDIARRKEIRRRLEEVQERRSIDDTYSFDMNED